MAVPNGTSVKRGARHYRPRLYQMTQRQQEYVLGLWEGLSNREIAERLGVSIPTVKKTLQTLAHHARLPGRWTRSKVVRWAIEEGHLNLSVLWETRLARAKEQTKKLRYVPHPGI